MNGIGTGTNPINASDQSIINLNVGGRRFSTSRGTLTWIPDSFFTSLVSGRIPTVKDELGAIFIDRDPDVFRVILNYLRTKQVELRSVSVSSLKHEALFFGLAPLVRRLTLCEELEVSACGSVLFHALIPAPPLPLVESSRPLTSPKQRAPIAAFDEDHNKTHAECSRNQHNHSFNANNFHRDQSFDQQLWSGNSTPKSSYGYRRSGPEFTRYIKNELSELLAVRCETGKHLAVSTGDDSTDTLRVRIIRAHHNSIAVAYAYYVCVYRVKESVGWKSAYRSPKMPSLVKHVALHTKFGSQSTEKMLAVALDDGDVCLWNLGEENGVTVGKYSLGVAVDKLFFIGSQMVALSRTGKVGIWHSMTGNWQVQDVVAISCYDTAGSSLLLGCTNGSMYYIDMQKFPLRMKDNDLLVTELYRDPNGDAITAISVYLTPKTNLCGNWIEIAYGTSSGAVRVIVQHPETVGHGPQLFQTYTVHNSPVTRVALTTNHLISVCAEYNHVRSWGVTRFRGMISTQPGSTSLASFKVLTLDSADDPLDREHTDPGPYGDQDGEQVFVQRVVPDTNHVFVRLASTGDRLCTIRSVDGSAITAFTVHECEGGAIRMGSRPRRYLFTGTSNGCVQMWDLTTALDQYNTSKGCANGNQIINASGAGCGMQGNQLQQGANPPSQEKIHQQLPLGVIGGLHGPSPQELLTLIDECEICCSQLPSPLSTPHHSVPHLPSLDETDKNK
ncbi:unnamed protein product, partial [Mesorhabditis belari]|uniref:BTB domain-containing protein n=1 Tax=Mesorhabditis belari TaxID=2138241 RepID=A0AAF3EWE1_9BILA